MNRKKVIITGASRGIGAAISEAALELGIYLILIGKSDELPSNHPCYGSNNIEYISADLSKIDGSKIIKEYLLETDDIYGLINNAGVWVESPLGSYEEKDLDLIFNLNIRGTTRLTNSVIDKLTTPGRIINISSQLGSRGRERMALYSASKHAVLGLTKSWAKELADKRITVNAVSPGWIDTLSNKNDILKSVNYDESLARKKRKKIERSITMKRFITEKEVASLVIFLLSSSASGITGQNYEIM